MTERKVYTREEVVQLRAAAHEGETPECPRCGTNLHSRRIPPGQGVSYVRRRIWWVCEVCGRSVVLDEPR